MLVVVPRLGPDDGPERIALTGLTLADLRDAPHPVTGIFRFARTAFDPLDAGGGDGWIAVAPGVFLSADAPHRRPRIGRAPTDPGSCRRDPAISLASLAALVMFGVGGYGWARAASVTGVMALAFAAAFGWMAVVLVAIALERVGVPLTGGIGPTVVSTVAVSGGCALRLILERHAGPRPSA